MALRQSIVTSDVGEFMLIAACEAMKVMNAPPSDPSAEDSPQEAEAVEKEEADAAGSGDGSRL